MEGLADKVIKGAIWSGFERFGYLGIQFIANLVMVRLLTPTDFGIIGILLIFTSISNVLADSGLGTALVQKKDINSIDCNSIFYTNIALGIFLYYVVYISSYRIGAFFDYDKLDIYLRAIGVTVIIDSFSAIPNSLLIRDLSFKKIAIVKTISALLACGISIILALRGYGIWALILQYVLYSIFRLTSLYVASRWRPKFEYSFNSLKTLLGFGSNLMVSNIISDLYLNFQSLLIGKFLNPRLLGYYTQAKQLQQVPVAALTTIVNQVTFPAFSKIQNEKERFTGAFKNNVILLAFVNFPLMFLLSSIAYPLIGLLYSDKWLPTVPYFQFLCLGFGILLAIHNTNLTALKALGKSGIVLKLEIIKKIIGIILLCLGMWLYGIWGLLTALSINSVIELFLNGHYVDKYVNISTFTQIKWFGPILIFAFISCLTTLGILHFISADYYLQLIVGIAVYGITYILLMYLFNRNIFLTHIMSIIKRIKF